MHSLRIKLTNSAKFNAEHVPTPFEYLCYLSPCF